MFSKGDRIGGMDNFQLFAVTKSGLQRLETPAGAAAFEELYQGLALGVYSALRTFSHNKFLDLDGHLARMKRSMALLGQDNGFDEGALRQGLHEAATAFPGSEARARLDLLSQPAMELGSDSRMLIALTPFAVPPERLYEEGVAVDIAPELSRKQPLAKTADFAARRRAYVSDHQHDDVQDFLMLDESGHILEGTGSNFYGVRDGVFYTAGEGVLEGITRSIILSRLPELGIPLRLEAVGQDELADLDEAAISSSSRALLPVIRVGSQQIGDGRPGPVCRRVLLAYNEFVASNIKLAIEW